MDPLKSSQHFMNIIPNALEANGPPPRASMIRIPLFGRIHYVHDLGGILQVGFVFLYWIYGTFSALYIVVIPGYQDGHISGVFVAVFLSISALCLSSLIRANTLNPGHVPDISDIEMLQATDWVYCPKCQRKRPPRAHHCRRCGQCVTRMDHHCPWINNCVGEDNHYAFVLLLLYAFLLSAACFILCMLHFWVYPKCQHCDKEAFFIKHSIWFMYVLTVLAANMALMMGIQLIGQHFNLIVDRTTLENMMQPLDASTIKFRSHFTQYEKLCGGKRSRMLLWLLPCRRKSTSLPAVQYTNHV